MAGKAVVTGGAGFMGSHVAEQLLKKGFEVTVMDNLAGGFEENVPEGAEFVKGDLRDRKECAKAVEGAEIVFHLAAHAAEIQSIFTPIYNTDANNMAFMNLAVESINRGVKTIVYTSTMAVYGEQEKMPYTEKQLPEPEDIYGINKYAIEKYLQVFHEVYGLEYAVIRPHNVYGPRQNMSDPYRNVLAIWCNRILKGKPPIVYGNGNQRRSFTYIEDCAPWIIEAGLNKKCFGEAFNIGSEEPVTLNRAAETVLKAMGKEALGVEHAEARPQEVSEAFSSSEKARKIMGYESRFPLEKGVKLMADWAKEKGPVEPAYWEKMEISKNVFDTWANKKI